MQTKTMTSVLVSAFSLFGPVWGQDNIADLKSAIRVLKGQDTSMEKTQALKMLEESELVAGDGYALSVLGIAYLHGIGTEADTCKALSLLEKSGSLGYTPAYHNLGMYYKYAKDGKQDFFKAYEAYCKGAEKKSISNYYNCGFMLYKGLGCQQDYCEAIKYFQRAADYNHADAIYMLGLCYRNGYGVEADTAVANAYLNQAANLGCVGAMDELLNEEPENSYQHRFVSIDASMTIPERMPDIDPYIPNYTKDIAGNYNGSIVTYDWSGNNVIAEKPLMVSLDVEGKTASGLWVMGNDSIPFTASLNNDGTIKFDSVEVTMYNRYAQSYASHYRFEYMKMCFLNGTLTGDLRLYSLSEMEPDRPMYVSLKKNIYDNNGTVEGSDIYSRLDAYSSPSSGQLILKFLLAEEASDVKVSFYTQTGLNCLNYQCGSLESGEQMITLTPNLSAGYYTIQVSANNQNLRTVIVK